MNRSEWNQASSLFFRCMSLSPAERTELLRQQDLVMPVISKNVRAMVAAHERDPEFLTEVAPGLRAFLQQPDREWPAAKIGDFEVVRELGRGGMGTVYLARRVRDEFAQEVAIKVIRNGLNAQSLIERFRRERKILARLEHPYIARLLDGGSLPNGMPFLVMERVHGQPIDTYCSSQSLTVGEIILLFQKICGAVHYLHQNLIIHRDIKPGNILVDDNGFPKLLDFGVAKLVSQEDSFETVGGVPVGFTPKYASPEQRAGGLVTTAADIYSLGVVLFELLAGRLPDDQSLITDTAAPLPRDLVAIICQALHRDPQQRYASAADLSSDLGRYLEGKPVLVRAQTTGYLLKSFVRRHRPLIGAAAIFLCGLIATTVWALLQTQLAEARHRQAEASNRDLLRLSDTLLAKIPNALETMPGSTAIRADSMRQSVETLDRLASPNNTDDFKAQLAKAYSSFGDLQGNPTFRNLGETEAAIKSYRKALALLEGIESHSGAGAGTLRDLASTYEKIGTLEQATGSLKEAIHHFHRAAEIYSEVVRRSPRDSSAQIGLAESYHDLGRIEFRKEQFENAIGFFEKEIKIDQLLLAAQPQNPEFQRNLSIAYRQNAVTLAQRKRFAEAHDFLHNAKSIDDSLLKQRDQLLRATEDLGLDYSDLGTVYLQEGRPALALQSYQQSAKIRGEISANDPNDARAKRFFAASLLNVGRALSKLGRYRDAVQSFEDGLTHFAVLMAHDRSNTTVLRESALGYLDLGYVRLFSASEKIPTSTRTVLYGRAEQDFALSLQQLQKLKVRTPENIEYDRPFRLAQDAFSQCQHWLAQNLRHKRSVT